MEVEGLKIPLAGRKLPLDLTQWTVEDRLAGGVTLAGIAAALVVVGLVAMLIAPGYLPVVVLALALVVIVFHGAVAFVGYKSTPPEPHVAASRVPVVTLRCAECGTVFDLEDPGFRPLYHVCPGCGAQGVLEAEEKVPPPTMDYGPPAEAAGTPAVWAEEPPAKPHAGEVLPPPPPPLEAEPPVAPRPAPTAAAAVAEDDLARFRPPAPSAPPPPAKARKFKHTCKGCGNVRILTDDGTRPFVTTCEQCGRTAKLALP